MDPRHTWIIILALRLFVGLFWLDHGLEKINDGWLTKNALKPRLVKKSLLAEQPRRTYLNEFAITASRVLGVLVALGETAVGVALICGFWMKPAAWGALFLVLNIRFAYGGLFSWDLFGSSTFFPLLTATWAAAYLQSGRDWTIKKFVPALNRFEIP